MWKRSSDSPKILKGSGLESIIIRKFHADCSAISRPYSVVYPTSRRVRNQPSAPASSSHCAIDIRSIASPPLGSW